MNLKKTLSKLYKTGYFNSFELTKNSLHYRDCYNNIHVVHVRSVKFSYVRIGHVENWKEFKLTNKGVYEWVDCARFVDHVKLETTTNPDFVLRFSVGYLNPQI